jgi:hypothetical protein
VVGVPLGVVVGETVPHCAAEQDTLQVTPLFAESLATVEVNCAVAPASTVAVAAETETLMGGGGIEEPPQPERIVAVRYPIAIKAIQAIFLVLRMAKLLSQSAARKTLTPSRGLSPGTVRASALVIFFFAKHLFAIDGQYRSRGQEDGAQLSLVVVLDHLNA